jgi:hypothetical protein
MASLTLALHRVRDTRQRRTFVALFTFQTAQIFSFPRHIFAPGVCNFASLTRIEGWAERRETFGCSAEHPWGVSCASKTRVNALMTRYARRLRGALRPMTRDARLSALRVPNREQSARPNRDIVHPVGQASTTVVRQRSHRA